MIIFPKKLQKLTNNDKAQVVNFVARTGIVAGVCANVSDAIYKYMRRMQIGQEYCAMGACNGGSV